MANARTTYGKVAAPRIRKIDIALARRPDLFPYLMVVMVLLTLVSIFHVWSRVKVIDMNLQIAEMSPRLRRRGGLRRWQRESLGWQSPRNNRWSP